MAGDYIEGGFVYAGDKIPIGGTPGQILTKIKAPHYYTAWRTIEDLIDQQALAEIIADNLVIDDGEYF